MKYNPDKHHRHSIRLQGYDYSSEGAYFVTICVKDRECLFGKIQNKQMMLNEYGKIVEQCWLDLYYYYENIVLDAYIIMPNHFHGVIFIVDLSDNVDNVVDIDNVRAINVRAIHESPLQQPFQQSFQQESSQQSPIVRAIHELPLQKLPRQKQQKHRKMLLPKIIGRFKMNSAKHINQIRNTPGIPVWQRNYYEHIIRNEESLNNIRKYIINNPLKWLEDEYNF